MANKNCMVYETLGKVSDLQVLESATGKNEVRLHGVFGVCGVRNNNRRVYNKENYGMMVEALQNVIANEGCPGELEHPNTMNITLENVSHKIESIEMNEDGTITGTILLLNTPKGKIAQAIVESGLPLYISSRGAGSIDDSGNVTLSTIKTYDLVGTPGFSQAKLTLKENQTYECLNESLEDGNIMFAIVENDEFGHNPNEKKEEKPAEEPVKSDDKPAEDPKPAEGEEKKDDSSNGEGEGDDTNNDDDINMKDLKEAIDKLTEKVTSLEAELHVAKESLEPKYAAIEQWITEEFAPEVQAWVTEEFAPEVQNWVTEEFAPVIEGWLGDEFTPNVITEAVDSKISDLETRINENVSAFLEAKKDERFVGIDKMIESLEGLGTEEEILEKLTEAQKADTTFAGYFAVENMPAQYRPMWESLATERKVEIARQSKMYDFTKQGILESFWAGVKFVNNNPVNEAVDVVGYYHAGIAAQMRRMMHK